VLYCCWLLSLLLLMMMLLCYIVVVSVVVVVVVFIVFFFCCSCSVHCALCIFFVDDVCRCCVFAVLLCVLHICCPSCLLVFVSNRLISSKCIRRIATTMPRPWTELGICGQPIQHLISFSM